MQHLNRSLTVSEEKWLKPLFNYCQENFSRIHLPSHDHFHHLRVWKYARSIIQELSISGIYYTNSEVEALIIAVFFHDMGMTKTLEKDHGVASRDMCVQYFEDNPGITPSNFELILEMIEKHDDKEYINPFSSETRPTPAIILNIADDLDAFGNIGVYRYTEIYHLRGIPVDKLSESILPNLEARFLNFSRQLGKLDQMQDIHRSKFERTRNFFETLQTEFNNPIPALGSCFMIIQLLISFADGLDSNIEMLFSNAERSATDDYGHKFFLEFKEEWIYSLNLK